MPDRCIEGLEPVRRLLARAREDRVPVTASVALTHRCNLTCRHCYIADAPADRAELTTSEWLRVLDEMAAAGSLFLLITGGEPLLRPDFGAIYAHAHDHCGMLTTVFTNGTCITEALAAQLGEQPPREVEVTLYGATPATYEAFTGVPGSFAECMSGIDRLEAKGVRVSLKTIVTRLNVHELDAMRAFAADRKMRFRTDTAVFPTLRGDAVPLALRLSPEEAAAVDFARDSDAEPWRALLEESRAVAEDDHRFLCAAGVTSCHVNATGMLTPCLMITADGYDLRRGTFSDGWNGPALRTIAAQRLPPAHPCHGCDKKALCGYCPPFLDLDGTPDQPSPWLCDLTHRRAASAIASGAGACYSSPALER